MSSITKKVSVNGWLNLGTQAKADGYAGSPFLSGGRIYNFNATVAYVHFTANGSTNPSTGADGLPIGTTAGTAPAAYIDIPKGVDMNGIWVNTSGAQDIKYWFLGA